MSAIAMLLALISFNSSISFVRKRKDFIASHITTNPITAESNKNKTILKIASKISTYPLFDEPSVNPSISFAGIKADLTSSIIPNINELDNIATAILFFFSSAISSIFFVNILKTLKLIKNTLIPPTKLNASSITPCKNIGIFIRCSSNPESKITGDATRLFNIVDRGSESSKAILAMSVAITIETEMLLLFISDISSISVVNNKNIFTESHSIKKENIAEIRYITTILKRENSKNETLKLPGSNTKLSVSIAGDIDVRISNIIPKRNEEPSIETAMLFFLSSWISLISLVIREKTLKLIKDKQTTSNAKINSIAL